MILETVPLNIRDGQNAAFETAFAQAQHIIARTPGYLSLKLHHCVEKRVRWNTLQDHEVGFHQSAQHQEWKQLLHHFYDPFPTVLHDAPVALADHRA